MLKDLSDKQSWDWEDQTISLIRENATLLFKLDIQSLTAGMPSDIKSLYLIKSNELYDIVYNGGWGASKSTLDEWILNSESESFVHNVLIEWRQLINNIVKKTYLNYEIDCYPDFCYCDKLGLNAKDFSAMETKIQEYLSVK